MSEVKPRGISKSLVVIAVIIALIVGIVAGYFIKPTAPAEVKTETVIKTETKTILTTTKETLPTFNWRRYEGETICFGIRAAPDADLYKEYIPKFEELTGIKVKYEIYTEEEYREKRLVDASAGTGVFDVYFMDSTGTLIQYIEAGWIEPLEPYIYDPTLTPPDFDINDFPLQQTTYNGKIYGIPVSVYPAILYVRKDLLDEAGLSIPKTFKELEEAAKKLHNPPKVYGFVSRGKRGEGANMWIFAAYFRSFGAKWLDEKYRPIFNSSEGIAAADYYARMLREFGPPGVVNYHFSECCEAFARGEVALWTECQTFASVLEDPTKSKVVGKVYYAPFFDVCDMFSWNLAINSASKHKKAAWLFITWLASKEMDKILGVKVGVPARFSTLESPEFKKAFSPEKFPGFIEAVKHGMKVGIPDARPRIKEWPEMGDIISAALCEVITGEKTAKQAFDEAAKAVYDLLKASGRIKE